MGMDVAGDHVRQWLGRPNVRLVVPGPDHVEIALRLLDATGTAANLTTAAQLASLAIEQNAQVYSHDTDFGRFAGLNWVDPLATS